MFDHSHVPEWVEADEESGSIDGVPRELHEDAVAISGGRQEVYDGGEELIARGS